MKPSDLRISVVVASFGRARLLMRCLTALFQQRYLDFEVIVVADADGAALAGHLTFGDRLKILPQGQANLAAARNDGVEAAAGDVLVFIDDDAVPEPAWLDAVASGFKDPDIAAVTGPVLGRNGVSRQWGQVWLDALGRDHVSDERGRAAADYPLKLHGTNMAVRRSALDLLGGFDRAFRFYLDDSDLAFRLGNAGLKARFSETAVVHHGFAASTRRSHDRVPLDLHDIGASTHVFLRKHAPEGSRADALQALEHAQRARLLRLARRRKLSARQMRGLMESLASGMSEGAGRSLGDVAITERARPFLPLRTTALPAMQLLPGWWTQAGPLRREAAARVEDGQLVTLFLFAPTLRKMRVRFTEGGWWEHSGGIYGCAERSEPRIQFWRFSARIAAERLRVAHLRGFSD